MSKPRFNRCEGTDKKVGETGQPKEKAKEWEKISKKQESLESSKISTSSSKEDCIRNHFTYKYSVLKMLYFNYTEIIPKEDGV